MRDFDITLTVLVKVSAVDLPDALATLACAVEDIQDNQASRETDPAEDDVLDALAEAVASARAASLLRGPDDVAVAAARNGGAP